MQPDACILRQTPSGSCVAVFAVFLLFVLCYVLLVMCYITCYSLLSLSTLFPSSSHQNQNQDQTGHTQYGQDPTPFLSFESLVSPATGH